jgi:tetratricopeptide (TPR) repeat protein
VQYRKVLGGHADYPWATLQLGGALTDLEKYEEAIGVLERGVDISENNFIMLGYLGAAYAGAGRTSEARGIVGRLRRLSSERYVTPMAIAYACLGLGDWDCYFQCLEEGFRQHTNYMAYLSLVPSPSRYGALREDPRFQDIIRRLGYDTE